METLGETARRIAGFFYGGFFDLDADHLQLGFAVLFWIGVVAGGWIACYVVRDLVFKGAAWIIAKLFPGYLDQFATHPPVPTEYKLR
jgi:hypothetical protein